MMSLQIICVGKLKEAFYKDAAAEYTKRLSAYCKLQLTELAEERLAKEPSPALIAAALEKEAAAIRGKLPKQPVLVALCIEGQMISSEDLSHKLRAWGRNQQGGQRTPVFVVGGSYGLHPSIKAEAALCLSMSPMTFPHHLARVMLLEQLYRGFKIEEGSSYHK